ncbi:phosphatase PAP2 family protein [Streptomyces sp. NPDC058642]|uniref:phosphatase PAP2 family protein n=1 Tax=Streptomyces sp. NPDC058642 TaxID=3346572 RepID=UPI00364631EF
MLSRPFSSRRRRRPPPPQQTVHSRSPGEDSGCVQLRVRRLPREHHRQPGRLPDRVPAGRPREQAAWARWSGSPVAWRQSRRTRATVPGVLYPVATLLVIISTANHFWADALGGLICLGFGFAFSYVWFGAFPWQLPQYVTPVPKGLRRSGGCPQ